jgi:hypothetical protein
MRRHRRASIAVRHLSERALPVGDLEQVDAARRIAEWSRVPDFGTPNVFVDPRRAMLGVRFSLDDEPIGVRQRSVKALTRNSHFTA